MQTRFKEEHFLIFILLIAALLRFYNLSEMSLMNDELSALYRAYQNSFSDLIKHGVLPDFHPAGTQVFIYYWIKIFGDSVFALRFPFALCGIAAVFATYKVGSLWFNKTTALFAAAALAILQFPLLYSQLARMYSMALLTTLVFTYCWSRLFVINNNSEKHKLLYSSMYVLSGAACLYLHYFALMFAGVVGLTGLFLVKKKDYKSYLLLNSLILILYLPHISVFLYQFNKGGIGGPDGWLPTPDSSTFLEYIKSFFNDSSFYLAAFLIPLICFIIFRKKIALNKFHWLSLWFYVIPFFIAYWYSVLRNPVLQITGLLFSLPYLLMFLFSFLPQQFNFKTAIALTSFVAVLLFSTLIDKKYYSTYHFGEYKELAELTISYNKKSGSENVTQVMNVQNQSYINYYFQRMDSTMHFALYKINDDATCAQLMNEVANSNTPYFIYAFTNMRNPPQIKQIIQSYYPYRVFRKDMFNAGFYVYSKNKIADAQQEINLYEFTHTFDNPVLPNDSLFLVTGSFNHPGHFADISEKEYGPTFEKKLSEMNYHSGSTLNASVKVFSPDTVKDCHLVLTIMKNDSAYVWLSADMKYWVTEKNKWTTVFTSSDIPKEFDGTETVKVFVWHRDKSKLLIDDLKITLTAATDYYRKGIQK